MARPLSQKAKLMIKAVEKFPQMSNRSIASYLYETYPTHFDSAEDARHCIKAHYSKSRNERVKTPSFRKGVRQTPTPPSNPFGLPETESKKRKVVHIQGAERVLWLSDIHFPNQDNDALTAALNYGKEHKIDCIVLGGDIMDNEPFTNHDAPPPMYSDVRKWFEMVESFLDMLIREFKCPIHWIEGNHDNWYQRYLMKKAPVLFHDEYYTLSSRLKLREKKINWHDQGTILMAGKLPMTHGHLIVKGFFSPVNPAKGVYNKIKSSMLIGHCHTTSEHSESNITHELTTTYSTGCLCTLAADYDPFNCKHNLGFAMIEVRENGNYRVHNKRIDYFTKEIY